MPRPRPLKVRLYVADTGEAMEWAMEGMEDVRFDGVEEFWQIDSLPLALNLVPGLHEAIARARLRGETVEVRVSTVPERRFSDGQSGAESDPPSGRLGADPT